MQREGWTKSDSEMGPCRYCWDYGGFEAYSVSGEGSDWASCSVSWVIFSCFFPLIAHDLILRGLLEYVRRLTVKGN